MKTCRRCKEPKPLDDFAIRRSSADGRQPFCRKCAAAYDRIRYRTGTWKAQIIVANKKTRVAGRTFVNDYLSKHPCVDCQEPDIVVLDFHHVRGKKRSAVTTMVNQSYSIAAIKAEIKKCVVVCANCHRRRHHQALVGSMTGHALRC